ncbi:hypothetical protein P8452_77933 [Trifolium repens]|nr:hypothetical protein P8452_77933 [Trifolium repens]
METKSQPSFFLYRMNYKLLPSIYSSQLVVIEAQIESPSSRTALAEAEFQTGYSSPTQDAIRKDLNLSLAEGLRCCICRVGIRTLVLFTSSLLINTWRNARSYGLKTRVYIC